MTTIGEMRSRAAYERYERNCAALGIGTDGWEFRIGRLSVRPEGREPWRIVTDGPTPGIPDGVCGDTTENAIIRLSVAARTLADLVELGYGEKRER